MLSMRLFQFHICPQTPLYQSLSCKTTRALTCISELGSCWGIKETASPWVTHTRKLLGLGLNDLKIFFSLPELAGNCMWADWARNGLNDQLEGKRSCFLYSSRVPVEEPYFPSHAYVGPVPSSLLCLSRLYICLTIMNWVLILQENIGHFHYMQSSKKAAKCATPLILNRILPKCHPETREWGYYKSEGIKSNFHFYKGVEGHDSCHTHTINWV